MLLNRCAVSFPETASSKGNPKTPSVEYKEVRMTLSSQSRPSPLPDILGLIFQIATVEDKELTVTFLQLTQNFPKTTRSFAMLDSAFPQTPTPAMLCSHLHPISFCCSFILGWISPRWTFTSVFMQRLVAFIRGNICLTEILITFQSEHRSSKVLSLRRQNKETKLFELVTTKWFLRYFLVFRKWSDGGQNNMQGYFWTWMSTSLKAKNCEEKL